MYIIKTNYLVDLKIVDENLQLHRDWLDEQYAKKILMASGPLKPRTGGILIADNIEYQELEGIMKEDPFYTENISEFEIFEFDAVKRTI